MSSSDETTASGLCGVWYSGGACPMPKGHKGCHTNALSVENARLRERVAALEGALVLHALPLADGLPCWCAGGWLEDGRHGAACLQSRAALAQADDGGRA